MSGVSPEDREKAIALGFAAVTGLSDAARDVVDALIAAGLLGGVSARPDRDNLIAALNGPQHAPIEAHDPDSGECMVCPVPLYTLSATEIADGLLAVEHLWTQPAKVKPEDVEFCTNRDCPAVLYGGAPSKHWHEGQRPSVPVVDPEALARVLYEVEGGTAPDFATLPDSVREVWLVKAVAIVASGVVEDRATVEREAAAKALEAFADRHLLHGGQSWRTAHFEAAEYREGRR